MNKKLKQKSLHLFEGDIYNHIIVTCIPGTNQGWLPLLKVQHLIK